MFCCRDPIPSRPGSQKHDPRPGKVYALMSPFPGLQDLHWNGRWRGPCPTFPVYLDNGLYLGGGSEKDMEGGSDEAFTEKVRTMFVGGAGVAGRVWFLVSTVRAILSFKRGCNLQLVPRIPLSHCSHRSQRANILQKSLAVAT